MSKNNEHQINAVTGLNGQCRDSPLKHVASIASKVLLDNDVSINLSAEGGKFTDAVAEGGNMLSYWI